MLLDNIPVHHLGENDFYIIERIENCDPTNFRGTHRHNFYELLYFTQVEDNDTHSIDFVEYVLHPNQVYLLRQSQVHSMIQRNQKGFLIAIDPAYFNRLCLHIESYADYTFPELLSIPDKEAGSLRLLIELMYNEFEGLHRKSLLNSYLHAFITHLMLLYTEVKSDLDQRVSKVLALIDTHFIQERTTEFYAGQIMLSNKRLNDLTKKAVSRTVKQLIDERLLLEAKRMISCGTQSFKEIAFLLGFSDASYFTRFFREQSGYTPEQFRLSLRKDLL